MMKPTGAVIAITHIVSRFVLNYLAIGESKICPFFTFVIHQPRPNHAYTPHIKVLIGLNLPPLPCEHVITKHVNSGFIGTDLQQQLTKAGIDTLVLVGLTTNHCVSTTARMAANLGFTTFVVSDGTATFDRMGATGERFDSQLVHEISLANLHGEFATVLTSAELLHKYTL